MPDSEAHSGGHQERSHSDDGDDSALEDCNTRTWVRDRGICKVALTGAVQPLYDGLEAVALDHPSPRVGLAAHYVVPHRQVVEAVVLRGCGQVDCLHLGAGGGGGRGQVVVEGGKGI